MNPRSIVLEALTKVHNADNYTITWHDDGSVYIEHQTPEDHGCGMLDMHVSQVSWGYLEIGHTYPEPGMDGWYGVQRDEYLPEDRVDAVAAVRDWIAAY